MQIKGSQQNCFHTVLFLVFSRVCVESEHNSVTREKLFETLRDKYQDAVRDLQFKGKTHVCVFCIVVVTLSMIMDRGYQLNVYNLRTTSAQSLDSTHSL
jgi:hypothetical protein